MALKLVNPGVQPLGQFDVKDADLSAIKGGEVVTFSTVLRSGSDLGAFDAGDGYQNPGTDRLVLTTSLSNGKRPLMLADDGTAGYGTLFGTVVGGTAGQQVSGGVALGPHTATGSGKLTVWDKPGMYAVTLDAVASDLAPTTSGIAAGASLFATSSGLLTTLKAESFDNDGASSGTKYLVVGNFVSFETDRTLVTTPGRLVAATGSAAANRFTVAVFHFSPDSNRYV